MKNVIPGHEIIVSGIKKGAQKGFEALPEGAQEWTKDTAKSAAKKVAQSEVGRQVTLGAVQGKKSVDDKTQKVSVCAEMGQGVGWPLVTWRERRERWR